MSYARKDLAATYNGASTLDADDNLVITGTVTHGPAGVLRRDVHLTIGRDDLAFLIRHYGIRPERIAPLRGPGEGL